MGAAIGMRRFLVVASAGGLALVALALPVGLEGAGRYLHPAVAAAADGKSESAGHPTDGGLVNSADAINEDADSAFAESADGPSQPAAVPVAEDRPATTNVIRELSGLPEDTELSDEEEREAIRNGWGTWRTADGPETLLAQ